MRNLEQTADEDMTEQIKAEEERRRKKDNKRCVESEITEKITNMRAREKKREIQKTKTKGGQEE